MLKLDSAKKSCVHHWLIEPAYESTSYGRCKVCGTVVKFLNDYQLALMKMPPKPAHNCRS